MFFGHVLKLNDLRFINATPKPVSMKGEKITRVILIAEIAIIVLLHMSKSNTNIPQTVQRPDNTTISSTAVIATSLLK